MTKAILLFAIMNFILSLFILVAIANTAARTWQEQKKMTREFDESLAELMTIIFNAEGIKAKAAEHPGESIDLEKLI